MHSTAIFVVITPCSGAGGGGVSKLRSNSCRSACGLKLETLGFQPSIRLHGVITSETLRYTAAEI
jgi:hypothetical protein